MDNKRSDISTNSIAFLALAVEYCRVAEDPWALQRDGFVSRMLKLLPRIYIAASDINAKPEDNAFIAESYLEEAVYDNVRENIARLLEIDDAYLEVFIDDMKYSDTPLGASISENLADIYQVLYNVVEGVRDSTTDVVNGTLASCKQDFEAYWGQTLCNVLRAMHAVQYNKNNY